MVPFITKNYFHSCMPYYVQVFFVSMNHSASRSRTETTASLESTVCKLPNDITEMKYCLENVMDISVATFHLRTASVENVTSNIIKQCKNFVNQLAVLCKQKGHLRTTEVLPVTLPYPTLEDINRLKFTIAMVREYNKIIFINNQGFISYI